jgi:hypothetical protein
MAMYSFVPPFREAKFCGVLPCVFDKLGCAAGENSLRNIGLANGVGPPAWGTGAPPRSQNGRGLETGWSPIQESSRNGPQISVRENRWRQNN